MNNTQSPKCPHVFLYLRAPFCYLVRSFGHLSSPSVSDSPSTKASEQIKPTAFSVSTNKLTKRGNASRRKKIRKQKKNIENYIYIYTYIQEPCTKISLCSCFISKYAFVHVEARAGKLSLWQKKRFRQSFRQLCFSSNAKRRILSIFLFFFFLLSFFQCDAFSWKVAFTRETATVWSFT